MKKLLLLIIILNNISCGNNPNNNNSKEEKPKEYRYYELVNRCGIDEECWNKLWDDFIKTMMIDMSDGILNDDYIYGEYENDNIGYYDIMEYTLKKMVNSEVKKKIYTNFLTKLKEVNEDERNVIMKHIGYAFSGIDADPKVGNWSLLEDDFVGRIRRWNTK